MMMDELDKKIEDLKEHIIEIVKTPKTKQELVKLFNQASKIGNISEHLTLNIIQTLMKEE
jgi:hypothetical protein